MKNIISVSLLAALILTFYGGTVFAASPLISELAAFRVVKDTEGNESLTSAAKAKPGDIIEYHCTYTNAGNKTLKNIKATLPIPEGLAYIEDTAQPHRFMASLNSKRFKQPPLYKTMTDPKGNDKRVKVQPDEYRAIQWYIGRLSAGDVRVVKARAQITKP